MWLATLAILLTLIIALMLALRAKEHPQLLESVILLYPIHVSTQEENRGFFLFQEDVCSNDVPFLIEHWPAPSEKWYSLLDLLFFCFFLNLTPQQMSEANWKDRSKLVTGWKRAQGQ